MILSMTGFGSHTHKEKNLQIKCEIHCVNKKTLEVYVNLPRTCLFAEMDLRKKVEETLKRGKITVHFDVRFMESTKKVVFQEALFDSFQETLVQISKKYKIQNNVLLSHWLSMEKLWGIEEEPKDPKNLVPLLNTTLESALAHVGSMRKREGQHLLKDLLQRLSKIEKYLQAIEARAPSMVRAYQDTLKKRIKSRETFTPAESDLFNRFVSVFADKSDVSEEITRLKSHFAQFRHLLDSQEPCGRSLDFLLQEFVREINTLGSKTPDLQATKQVIAIKTLIEQIREQVQNVL
jgi:uncharacterized protein (TIGR00255 family)